MKIPFNNRYIKLGEDFYVRTTPERTEKPELIIFNKALASELVPSMTDLNTKKLAEIFAGNQILEGAEPLAMVYAGHQFGQFNPQLGDGRAILLGEVCDKHNQTFSIQLKGSGRTVYSRRGDGRSALGPVLREYLVSEAMAKLGIPTTRALAAVTTGENVMRRQMVPGGILTRVANSFVRVGTFQYFAANDNVGALKKLADYVIDISYPEAAAQDNPYAALLEAVIDRQASLIAKWMQLGFIHGVMNTDNMSVAGETIDYGPCAFMDDFAYDRIFSSIDEGGLYAYKNQPTMGVWNLTRLAESLLSLLAADSDVAVGIAQAALKQYNDLYQQHWLSAMGAKIGLTSPKQEDKVLIDDLLSLMQSQQADFTLTFYYLSLIDLNAISADNPIYSLFSDAEPLNHWLNEWQAHLLKEDIDPLTSQKIMLSVNPIYIPRNHQIEIAIRAAEDYGDFSKFHELHQVLQNPRQLQTGKEAYMQPPTEKEVVKETFCGT
ncbi:MAG: serine/tyrosine/threonine adenylyltransferase [Thiomicrorhabdus sp.]|nr:MAG: serine/tyrosine/threonine adenylyltransferase [Thiomicrorhabdus sp.]